MGGVVGYETNGRYSVSYSARGWRGWTWQLDNPYPNGNIALQMRSQLSKIFSFYTGNTPVWTITVGQNGGFSMTGGFIYENKTLYLPDRLRYKTLYTSDGAVITGSPCGGVEVKWNNSPTIAVGDPVGWRCVNNTWHSIGPIL